MKRKIYDQLVSWKQDGAGRTALLIDGARRVGKSYVAEEFAKAEYKSYLLIDFNRVGDEVKDLFLHYLNDLDTLFMALPVPCDALRGRLRNGAGTGAQTPVRASTGSCAGAGAGDGAARPELGAAFASAGCPGLRGLDAGRGSAGGHADLPPVAGAGRVGGVDVRLP